VRLIGIERIGWRCGELAGTRLEDVVAYDWALTAGFRASNTAGCRPPLTRGSTSCIATAVEAPPVHERFA